MNGRSAAGQQPRISRSVHRRPVDQRVGVARRLHPGISRRTAVRVDPPAAEDRGRRVELVGLGVVDQITGLDDCHRVQPVDRRHHPGEHERGQRFLGPERRGERRAQPIEHLHACRRLLVRDVGVGQLCERHQSARRPRPRCELGAVAQRLARPPLEGAIPVRVDPGANPRRPGRLRCRVGGCADTSRRQQRHRDGGQRVLPAHRPMVARYRARL